MKKKKGGAVHRARGGSAVMASRAPDAGRWRQAKALGHAHRWSTNDARWRRSGIDDFPSPPWCVRSLVHTVLPRLGVHRLGVVAEPCCGRMIMAEVLAETATKVIASDVLDYGFGGQLRDYLDETVRVPETDWTITNPPFKTALPMTLRALRTSRDGVAIFERIQWAEGIDRFTELFEKTPPTLVALFVERVPLVRGRWKPKASTATCYMWMVWVRDRRTGGWRRPMAPLWIPPGQKLSLTLPDDVERFAWRTNRPRRRASSR